MNEMVERVAHALMAVTAQHECGDLKLKHHYEMARAAIAAMREPTEAMASRGVDAYPWDRARDQTTDFYVAGMFRAMIDDALGARDCPS